MFIGKHGIIFFKSLRIESVMPEMDYNLFIVVFGLTIAVFVLLKVAKFLSKIKINKMITSKRNYFK
jgi:hypothetical protein